MSDGYTHLKQSSDSWYIRFYLWLYDADPTRINTCKLLWAYILAFIVLPIRLFWEGVKKVDRRLPEPRRRPLSSIIADMEARQKAGPSRFERALDKISGAFSFFWAKLHKPLTWLFFAALGATVLFVLGLFVYGLVTKPGDVLLGVGIGMGICIMVGLGILAIEHASGRALARFWVFFKKLGSGFHRHTCAKIDLD